MGVEAAGWRRRETDPEGVKRWWDGSTWTDRVTGGSTSRAEVMAGTGWRNPVQAGRPGAMPTNGFAIASLVLALVGGSLLAVIFGHVANRDISRTGESGSGVAAWGLAIGYLSLLLAVFAVVHAYGGIEAACGGIWDGILAVFAVAHAHRG